MVVVVEDGVVSEDKEYDTIVVIGVLVGSGIGK
jgi:hypothetical protein